MVPQQLANLYWLGEVKKMNMIAFLSCLILLFLFNQVSAQRPGFYKDLFMDGGVGMISASSLHAADILGLTLEFIATEDAQIQNGFIVKNENDENGVLLYPDGQPRFRMIYTNGGVYVEEHGKSLGSQGREQIKQFYFNGGSYSGSCGGAYIIGCDNQYFYKLWSGTQTFTDIYGSYVGHFIPQDSPLLQYYSYGDYYYINGIYQNGGGYVTTMPQVTEILLRFDNPGHHTHNKPTTWAHKKDKYSGRLVVTGSHPEMETRGEVLEIMCAILMYALDGQGLPTVKALLKNG